MPQKLSPSARRAKAARDKAYAQEIPYKGKSTARFKRKDKKAENQRRRRAAGSEADNKDWDHKDKRWETPKQNRGNDGKGTKKESNANYCVKTKIKTLKRNNG